MYSNEKYFTKEPYEDNGRCKIHPLSSEGVEAYLSKDSYNYNYIKTKKNPELLNDIKEEIKKEKELREKMESKNLENPQKKEEDLKEEPNSSNNKNTSGKTCDKSKNKKGNNSKTKKCNMLNKNNKGVINKGYNIKKENNKRKQSPGARLANTIAKLGKVSGPVISNVNNDRGKLWEYPAPYHS